MITLFIQINSFTCFFFKKSNNFVGFITPVVEKWLIHMKTLVTASALLALYVSYCLMVDRTLLRWSKDGEMEVVSKSLDVVANYRGINSIYTTIYMYLGLYL